jgi:Zn-dependent metalloprotease
MTDHIVQHGTAEQRTWALETLRASEQFRGRRQVVGDVFFAVSPGEKRRTVYDAKNGTELPGTLVRGEGDPPSQDIAVNEAYDGAGATYDLFKEIYDRNSIDDRGLRLDSTVHYDMNYDNAFWNGDQMIYGDGDGQLFNRFTIAIDVIGHELTHGVTQYAAALTYRNQPGALNESFSDVFGTLVKQRSLNQTVDEADWLIGAGLLAPGVKGVALRSMKAPGTAYDDPVLGKDPQPAHYKDLYQGSSDNGGVHINSGIPNHAFYLAATAIGGFAWEKTGKIWYITLRDVLRANASFADAANATISVAERLYGQDSEERKAVQSAWQQVGVI